jgi:predicted ArsR family transcriptional regulator
MRRGRDVMPEDPDVRVHRALADETRVQLVRILRHAPDPLDVSALADRVDLHKTTVRGHLDLLVDAGLVTSHTENRTTPGRPRRLYSAVDGPAWRGDGYRLLAEMLAGHVAASATAIDGAVAAGRDWGTHLVDPPPATATGPDTARAALVDLMDRLGFRPELGDDGTTILLHRCPFLDVAKRHADVVCSLHLGIMRGALATLGAPVVATDLQPFVRPSLCVAHTAVTKQAWAT